MYLSIYLSIKYFSACPTTLLQSCNAYWYYPPYRSNEYSDATCARSLSASVGSIRRKKLEGKWNTKYEGNPF